MFQVGGMDEGKEGRRRGKEGREREKEKKEKGKYFYTLQYDIIM